MTRISTQSKRAVLLISLVAEAATAVALFAAPGVVGELLFGEPFDGAAVALARLLGAALIAMVIACWPPAEAPAMPAAVRGLAAYNALAACLLAYFGSAGDASGILLWPAVTEHALVAVLLALGRPAAQPLANIPP